MLFVHNILRVPRQNPLSRYLITIVVFLISGFLHAAAAPEIPLSCAFPQFRYQLSLAAALMLEDLVIMMYKTSTRQSPGPQRTTQSIKEEATRSSGKKISQSCMARIMTSQTRSPRPTSIACTAGSVVKSTNIPHKTAEITNPVIAPSLSWRLAGYCWVMIFTIANTSQLVYGSVQCSVRFLIGSSLY